MKNKLKKTMATLLAAALIPVSGITPVSEVKAASGKQIRLDPSEASPFNNGEFQGWGTSLCWWANRIGYSEELTQQAADAFFSDEGLGLDIARYNLGGGDDPTHNHITRSDSKIPGYATGFDDDGNIIYDWTVDENQRNIAKAALMANPDLYVEGFSNSPPYFMTNSGCSSGAEDAGSDNLNPEYYDKFGEFIATATKHFKEEFGIEFKSYSPMNEPDTTYWGANSPKQEGAHYTPGEVQSKTVIATRNALDAQGLTNVLVAGSDETDIGKAIKSYNALTDEAKTALGRIDTHTYSGSDRAGIKSTAVNAGKDLWMSEVDGKWNGIGLAERIILDMNGMQPAAWVMWDIIDSHKDSTFQAPDGTYSEANNSIGVTNAMWGVGMANHDTQTIELANKYYFFGQFTKYINPGDTIIASSDTTLAAYNKKSGDIKIVALNSSGSIANYTFDLSAFANPGNTAKVIRTNNSDEKWAEIETLTFENKQLSYTLPAQSLTTFVIEQAPSITSFTADENSLSYSYSVPSSYDGYDKYFAVYDSENNLKCITLNENEKTIEGDFTNSVPKLFVWDDMNPVCNAVSEISTPKTDFDKYAIIKGTKDKINLGSTIALSVSTNMDGDITWSSSNENVATVSADGTVKAIGYGDVTIYASVGEFVVSHDFTVPMYTLSGTASWGNSSNRPDDNADYTKIDDGDFSTYFDGTTGGWVQYEYPSPFKASEIKLAARAGYKDRTVGGTVQASNDGIDWCDIYTIETAVSDSEYTTISANELKNNGAYRYYRYINNVNMANISEFVINGELSADIPENNPVITDLAEFTDNFEGNTNIFDAEICDYMKDGNVVFPSGLARFGNAFAPARATATATLAEAKTLTSKDVFRLKFNMFAGWESGGKENSFAIKDADGNEIAAFLITGGGYNLNQVRIGGENLLENPTIAQCRSNPGTSKSGANGWGASGQPYVNTVGYNKSVEILIGGTGTVSIAITGGIEDTVIEGTLETPVSIGSIELIGDYNSAVARTVSYDNFDADIITYNEDVAAPTATPTPTDAPTIPENGELINLDFNSGNLTSASSYGKAEGAPSFINVDDKDCIQFSGSGSEVTLTDANGNPLLTGIDEMTISFKIKPTSTDCSWVFYTAPNGSAQTYLQEKYIGVRTQGGTLHTERYSNSGARSAETAGSITANEWHDVIISVNKATTDLYIDGRLADSQTSAVNIADMLGKNSVAYLGKANWGSGEYASGYLDDFVIKKGAFENPLASMDLGDLSAVVDDITLPTAVNDGTAVTWTSSDETVITVDGDVTRYDDTKTVTLTATTTAQGVSQSKSFTATVVGYTASAADFAAYTENGSVIFTSTYGEYNEIYDMYIELKDGEDNAVGDAVKNTASGSFDNLAEGTYTISCTLKQGDTTKKEVVKTMKIKQEQEMGAYLFAHFIDAENDATKEQIYFSVSTDGTEWTTLNGGAPILTSNVGELGVRDPYILRGEDGKFFIIATDLSIYNRRDDSNRWGTCQTSGSKSIVVWESDDLVNWSDASLVKVAPDNAGCTWAPECVYDAEKDAYMVFWASKTADDNYSVQRVYKCYTKDFKTFTAPEIYIDGGNISNIDTTIISHKGVYYRFTKNESKSSVTMMESTSLSGDWVDVETYTINGVAGNTITGYEGPTVYKINGEDKWCLLLDYYSKSKGYKPFVTDDITKGEFTSAADFTFDGTYRHGTVMPITLEEYNALTEKY